MEASGEFKDVGTSGLRSPQNLTFGNSKDKLKGDGFSDAVPFERKFSRLFESSAKIRLPFDYLTLTFSLVFLYILWDVVVGITYQATQSLYEIDLSLITTEGNPLRQVIYVLLIACVFFGAALRSRLAIKIPISMPYLLAVTWCLASAVWAIEPAQSIRRSLLMAAILLPFSMCCYYLGARTIVRLTYLFLASVIVASIISVFLHSIPLFSFSIHPGDEADPSVAGSWRGVLNHKNAAGPIAVHAAIVFYCHTRIRRKWYDYALLLLAILFLVGTKSKTAIGLFAIAFVFGAIYKLLMSRRARAIFVLIAAYALCTIGILIAVEWDAVVAFFSDGDNLTGRVIIWQSMMPYIMEHFWLGSGYGSFWGIGDDAPMYTYALSQFILRLGTSHNGYLEIWATTGTIGLGLTLFAVIIQPFLRFASPKPNSYQLNSMLFMMWLFGILQNLTESQFFSPEKQSWIFVIIALSLLQSQYRVFRSGAFDQLRATHWPSPLPNYILEPPVQETTLAVMTDVELKIQKYRQRA